MTTEVEFKAENCIGCGLCERVCPKGSITVTADGNFNVIIDDTCVNCGICAVYCQYGALSIDAPFTKLLEKVHYSKIDVEGCVYCGVCAQNCPRDAITVKKVLDKDKIRHGYIKIYEGCIECRNCVMFCPVDAIRIERGSPAINEDKCIYCEICEYVCPKNVIEIHCDSCKMQRDYAITGEIKISEACSTCGICREVCSFEAIRENKLFTGIQIYKQENCFGRDCQICREVCPNNAIEYKYDGGKIVVFNERCNFCGACERFCPGNAIEIKREVVGEYEDIHLPPERRYYKEKKHIVEVSEACISCGICESLCKIASDNAFSINRGELTPENCTSCGVCQANCPMEAIRIIEKAA